MELYTFKPRRRSASDSILIEHCLHGGQSGEVPHWKADISDAPVPTVTSNWVAAFSGVACTPFPLLLHPRYKTVPTRPDDGEQGTSEGWLLCDQAE